MLDEALVEHDSAKILVAELREGTPDDEYYDAKVKVLSELVKHHVKEEEKRHGIFAEVRGSDIDLAVLGEQLMTARAGLMADPRCLHLLHRR
jgi:hypothetical protein